MVRVLALGMVLALCAVLGAAESVSAFSVGKEIALGEQVSKEVEKEMPLSGNQQWQQEIREMGKRFTPLVTRKEIPYHFSIVKADDQLNAFALPGGYVYFTERMWRILTPDERAAVMAHEITHCDQRHGIDQMLKAQQRSLWMLPLIVLSGGSAMAGYAIGLGDMVISQRYSRKMEREADELGIRLTKNAGFNPAGSVTSMEKLLHVETDENHYEISSIFASHPDTLKRIEYLKEEALQLGAKPSELELKAVDDPSRLGNVTRKSSDVRVIYGETTKPLEYGDKVQIRKMLWDEQAQAVTPQTIAVATVLIPGRFPAMVIEKDEEHRFGDVMQGDGIFPNPPTEPADTVEPAAE